MVQISRRSSWNSTIRELAIFFGFYVIHFSVRTLGINWGILEEMRRQQASFIITCRSTELLYCLFALEKHKVPVVGKFDWDKHVGLIENLGYRLWQTPLNSTLDEWESNFSQQIQAPQLWVPVQDSCLQGFSILQIVKLAKNQQKKILPVSCKMPSSFIYSSSGVRFPYPFSKVVVLMGNPIHMDVIPDELACSRLQHTLDHLSELAHNMLQKMHTK